MEFIFLIFVLILAVRYLKAMEKKPTQKSFPQRSLGDTCKWGDDPSLRHDDGDMLLVSSTSVNPSTGLSMNGGLDVGGSPYGSSPHD